jgi:hypothetical protein
MYVPRLAICLLTSLYLAGCATKPPPPRPYTPEEARAAWEQRIQAAVAATYSAGGDGEAVYEQAHLQGCLYDAQKIADGGQRSAAIHQCRVDWPRVAPPPAVSTTCVQNPGVVSCVSQ